MGLARSAVGQASCKARWCYEADRYESILYGTVSYAVQSPQEKRERGVSSTADRCGVFCYRQSGKPILPAPNTSHGLI